MSLQSQRVAITYVQYIKTQLVYIMLLKSKKKRLMIDERIFPEYVVRYVTESLGCSIPV